MDPDREFPGFSAAKAKAHTLLCEKEKSSTELCAVIFCGLDPSQHHPIDERKPKDPPTWIPDSYPLEYEIEAAAGQRNGCKQGPLDSPNKGVITEMDTFVTSYDGFSNAGSDSALFKFRQPFRTVTDLRNHNIEHGTKELCAGMPSLCLRTSSGEWRSFSRFLC